MDFELRYKDSVLAEFSAEYDSRNPKVRILRIVDKYRLPVDMRADDGGLESWLRKRNSEKTRAFVHNFLNKYRLNINHPLEIILASKGLSLNDCYWITEKGFEESFEKYNLFDNEFDNIAAEIAMTGRGEKQKTLPTLSPEFTTQGMMPKCWQRVNGKILLYKGGTEGCVNTGFEPYCEYYSSQLANYLGINAVTYDLEMKFNGICSVCELFTDKSHSFVTVKNMAGKGSADDVLKLCNSLGNEFVNALREMTVFDALVFNADRHIGNFGFIVDNESNKIIKPAMLFDYGSSLFNFAMPENFKSDEALTDYAENLRTCIYGDIVSCAKSALTAQMREKLKTVNDFKFKKHPLFNISENRLEMTERQIKRRAKQILA